MQAKHKIDSLASIGDKKLFSSSPVRYYMVIEEIGNELWKLSSNLKTSFGQLNTVEYDSSLVQCVMKANKESRPYFEKAIEYYILTISKDADSVLDPFVVLSNKTNLSKLLFEWVGLNLGIGRYFEKAPPPEGLTDEELVVFKELLKEKKLEGDDFWTANAFHFCDSIIIKYNLHNSYIDSIINLGQYEGYFKMK
jgi:hypothetical protein